MSDILKTVFIESLVAPNIANVTNTYAVLCSGCLYFLQDDIRKYCNVNTPASVSWRCVSTSEENFVKNTLMDYFPIDENDPSSDGSFIIYSKSLKPPLQFDGFHNVKYELDRLGQKYIREILYQFFRFTPPKEDHMPSLRYAFIHSGISYSDRVLAELELELS